MKCPSWLPGLTLCLGLIILTAQFWYIIYVSKTQKEGFDTAQQVGLITSQILGATAQAEKESPPSDMEAARYYRALLIYLQSDYTKGLRIVYDMNKRVYGKYEPVPNDFDPRKILDNFKNPITGL